MRGDMGGRGYKEKSDIGKNWIRKKRWHRRERGLKFRIFLVTSFLNGPKNNWIFWRAIKWRSPIFRASKFFLLFLVSFGMTPTFKSSYENKTALSPFHHEKNLIDQKYFYDKMDFRLSVFVWRSVVQRNYWK